MRDPYCRNGRYFRDGRYWDRDDYMRRYYGHDDSDNNLPAGVIVGAAVVGVTAAIISAQND